MVGNPLSRPCGAEGQTGLLVAPPLTTRPVVTSPRETWSLRLDRPTDHRPRPDGADVLLLLVAHLVMAIGAPVLVSRKKIFKKSEKIKLI